MLQRAVSESVTGSSRWKCRREQSLKVSQGAVIGSVTGSSHWKSRREQQLLIVTGSSY